MGAKRLGRVHITIRSRMTSYKYQIVTADLYLHAFLGGYPGIELLKFLGGIIENPETHNRQ
jgi:hypothetical protein